MLRFFIGAVASLALAGTAVSAAPGGDGKGHDKGHGGETAHGKAQQGSGGDKGSGNDQAGPASAAKAQKDAAKGSSASVARREDPPMQSPVRPDDRKQARSDDAGKGQAKATEKKGDEGQPPKAGNRTEGNQRSVAAVPRSPERKDLKRATFKGPKGKPIIVPTNDRVRVVTDRRDFDWGALYRRSAFDGCPPGLAKKYNDCMPPGLDRQAGYSWLQPAWYLPDYDRSYRYRYLDGYMLRLGPGDSVLSYIPLLGGALGIGQIWPSAYDPIALPPYYDDYYDLGPADSYRYYDDAIYRVDPDTAAIQSVAALLTGTNIAIGEPMPAGYDIYNVPYGYRDQYYDGPDALYRYSDGYIYQLDPTTRLVQAAIELLV